VKTFVQGTNLTIAVPLQRDGEPFVADGASVSWALHGQDGTTVATGTQAAPDSTVLLPIISGYNTLVGSHQFEKRFVVLNGTVGGLPFVIRFPYLLIVWNNVTATEDDVRTFIGIGPGELPNSEIDLAGAYMDVVSYTSQAIVDNALIAANESERAVNRAIVARAVLTAIPSMVARISKSESDGTIDVTRQDLDIPALQDQAAQQLSRNLDIFSPRLTAIPALVAFAARDDIFLPSCAPF
jgi:hypothetical protein